MKVGTSVVVARRGGITTTYNELNKFITISGMSIESGQYWNGFHDVHYKKEQDLERLQKI